MGTGNEKPLQQVASWFFNFEVSKEGGLGASVFSRAAAQLQYAATSALNIAQWSAVWLTQKARRITYQWAVRLNDIDDTVLDPKP
jgi:hypothetical protein